MLMALDLPLPQTLLAHGHWTMDKFKMSKSRGNVADPFEAMKTWGTDAMRIYLMRVGGDSSRDAGSFYSFSFGQEGTPLKRPAIQTIPRKG
jgi:methionyl-tRNA synthetase